ncbi:hypothetical protein [Rhizorhapis sp. SPR117]|uniref:hypothetical protein n=1 Tax=Rhizorhapis sp. SPR117 TaxID=2912611 RepID=UPI001F247D36|nr:hypothetical protein [Rhizorhapis sp. SPR117]
MQAEAIPIADRIESANALLADLEAEQGAAVLDGKPFDPAPIAALRHELEALSAAEAETVRRDRKAAALQAEDARELSRTAAESEAADLLKAVAKVEKMFSGAADAIEAMLASAQRLSVHMRAAGIGRPMILDKYALRSALSRSMGAEMARLHEPGRFGNIYWRGIPPKPEWDKTKSEIRAVAASTKGKAEHDL